MGDIFFLEIWPHADPKRIDWPFVVFWNSQFWLTDPKIFLKAPLTPKYTNCEVGVGVKTFFCYHFTKIAFLAGCFKKKFYKKTQFFCQHFPKKCLFDRLFRKSASNQLLVSCNKSASFQFNCVSYSFPTVKRFCFLNFRAVHPNNADDGTLSQWQTWMIGQMARLRLVDVFHEKCHRVINFSAIAADVIKESLKKPHHRLKVDLSVKKINFWKKWRNYLKLSVKKKKTKI